MTIRLTSVEAFERVLEKLKHNPLYSEVTNEPYLKYCVDMIKEGITNGKDTWYLDVDFVNTIEGAKLVLRYHRGSEIMTDEEYLAENDSDDGD